MSFPSITLPEAEVELQEGIEFYEARCPGLGADFAREITQTLERIQDSPQRWPLRQDGTRRALVNRFPYFAIFIYYEERVSIVAFAHAKRRPGYWAPRIRKALPRRRRHR